jgi:putative inorganic carbon (HCO3(-)) transporter
VLAASDNPVTGIGLSMVARELELGVPPHNDLLRMYVETGVVGLLAYCMLLVTLALVAWRCARRAPTPLGRAVGVAATGCVALFLWLSVSSNLISQVVVLWYLFAPLGAASAALDGWRPDADRLTVRPTE